MARLASNLFHPTLADWEGADARRSGQAALVHRLSSGMPAECSLKGICGLIWLLRRAGPMLPPFLRHYCSKSEEVPGPHPGPSPEEN